MKVRESGMPEEERWGAFFNVPEILKAMEVDRLVTDLAEFGCGYGTFTIPAAKAISGKIYALDIEPEMVDKVIRRGQSAGSSNIVGMVRDFIEQGAGLPDHRVDYVMLFNIMHDEHPARLLNEAYRLLRPDGKLGIIHWNYDHRTPRGPPMAIRPRPEQCAQWANQTGFTLVKRCDLKPYHYGLLFKKPRENEHLVDQPIQ